MNLKAETQDAPRKAVAPIIFTLFLSDAAAELTYPSLIYRDTKLSLQMEAEAASACMAPFRWLETSESRNGYWLRGSSRLLPANPPSCSYNKTRHLMFYHHEECCQFPTRRVNLPGLTFHTLPNSKQPQQKQIPRTARFIFAACSESKGERKKRSLGEMYRDH